MELMLLNSKSSTCDFLHLFMGIKESHPLQLSNNYWLNFYWVFNFSQSMFLFKISEKFAWESIYLNVIMSNFILLWMNSHSLVSNIVLLSFVSVSQYDII